MQNREERDREVEVTFRLLRRKKRKDLLVRGELSVCFFYLFAW